MWSLRFGGGSDLKKGIVVGFDRFPLLNPRSRTSGGPCRKRTAVGVLSTSGKCFGVLGEGPDGPLWCRGVLITGPEM